MAVDGSEFACEEAVGGYAEVRGLTEHRPARTKNEIDRTEKREKGNRMSQDDRRVGGLETVEIASLPRVPRSQNHDGALVVRDMAEGLQVQRARAGRVVVAFLGRRADEDADDRRRATCRPAWPPPRPQATGR